MTGRSGGRATPSIDDARAILTGRLRKRSREIEEAIFACVRSLSEPVEDGNGEYLAGLRTAVAAALEFGLMVIEHGEEWSGSIPPAVADQARRAARSGVKLDTILRRYAAGDKLLEQFIFEESDDIPNQVLRVVLGGQGPQIDRLMAFVTEEYRSELERVTRSPSRQLAKRVQQLLANDRSIDVSDLNYDFDDAWHLGMIVRGGRSTEVVRVVAAELDRQALLVPQDDETVWAWLGGRRLFAAPDVEQSISASAPADLSVAIGEPRKGVNGWRLTHREAQASFQVLLHKPQGVTRCSDVVLVAAVLRDQTLTQSLLSTYLAPLDGDKDSGTVLRETLRTYLEVGQNAASTASALRVDRSTVQRRLQRIEERLGRLLDSCHAELKVALQVEELMNSSAAKSSNQPGFW